MKQKSWRCIAAIFFIMHVPNCYHGESGFIDGGRDNNVHDSAEVYQDGSNSDVDSDADADGDSDTDTDTDGDADADGDLTVYITDDNDDVRWFWGKDLCNGYLYEYLFEGYFLSTGNGYSYYYGGHPPTCMGASQVEEFGLRFTNINIPRNAVINSASVLIKALEESEEVFLEIQAFSEDNSSRLHSFLDAVTRSRTTESVIWNQLFTTDVVYQTPDLSEIVQVIVNRKGWSSGNSIHLVFSDYNHKYDSLPITSKPPNGSNFNKVVHFHNSQSFMASLTISYIAD